MHTSEEKIASLVSKLNKTFKTKKTLSYEWRYAQLRAMQRLVKENTSDIEAAISTDLGLCLTKATSEYSLNCDTEKLTFF
jgi:acyl-CoA reductase-like NAD-dependent aldehyde dehydrogenase